MKNARGVLSFEVTIECPECGHSFDLIDSPHNDDCEISVPIFNNKWDDFKSVVVDCPACDKQFEIKEVVY